MVSNTIVVSFAISVGFTISIDIFFYTLAKCVREKLGFFNWVVPATTSHFLLMGVVCLTYYYLNQIFYHLHLPLGVTGALFIGRYIYEIGLDWQGKQPPTISLTAALKKIIGHNRLLSWLTPAVLVVSWDCIPVALGVAIETDKWTVAQVTLWLLVIGATVALATSLSICIAKLVNLYKVDTSLKIKVLISLISKWVIWIMLGAFGLLSLIKGFAPFYADLWRVELYQMLPVSFCIASTWFTLHLKTLWRTQCRETLADQP